jgi:hypothetical protein
VIRVAAALVAAVVLAGCGGGGDESTRPALADIAPAVAAVEEELGGPQQYFEINATPQVVNLFVASADGTGVTPFVYVGDALAPAGQPSTAEGNTFAASAMTFDPDTILEHVTEDLPGSDIVLFTVVGGPGGAVQYSAGVQSAEGGTLDVVLGADGSVQSVDPGP